MITKRGILRVFNPFEPEFLLRKNKKKILKNQAHNTSILYSTNIISDTKIEKFNYLID